MTKAELHVNEINAQMNTCIQQNGCDPTEPCEHMMELYNRIDMGEDVDLEGYSHDLQRNVHIHASVFEDGSILVLNAQRNQFVCVSNLGSNCEV